MVVRAVATTGIYCRSQCAARPDVDNVSEFALPAAAEAAGYRACHRCRPYRHDDPPGAIGPELICTAVRLVCDGALDQGTESDLGALVGVSPRHLRRLFVEHLGVTPDALARSRRAHFARRLLDDTDLPVTDVALAAGYGSVRQLQRACAGTFGESPSELRARRRSGDRIPVESGLSLRMGRPRVGDTLARPSVPAPEDHPAVEIGNGSLRCQIDPPEGPGHLELRSLDREHLELHVELEHWHGLVHVVRRARRLATLLPGPKADADAADAEAANA
jgi:AraC family transcriptional regulator of adaptative response / DNA-3-methyladenine glycosylase II